MRLRRQIQYEERKCANQRKVAYRFLIGYSSSAFLSDQKVWFTSYSSLYFLDQLLSDAETVRWLNYAVEKIWPVCMERVASQKFLLPIFPWFLEKFKPWTAVSIEFLKTC